MKNRINKKTLLLSACALALVGSASIQSAMAYFTTYVTAKGGHEISFDTTTTIEEEKVVNHVKQVRVQNTGANPCYVRVKYFVGTQLFDLAPTKTDGWKRARTVTGIIPRPCSRKGLRMAQISQPSWVCRWLPRTAPRICLG